MSTTAQQYFANLDTSNPINFADVVPEGQARIFQKITFRSHSNSNEFIQLKGNNIAFYSFFIEPNQTIELDNLWIPQNGYYDSFNFTIACTAGSPDYISTTVVFVDVPTSPSFNPRTTIVEGSANTFYSLASETPSLSVRRIIKHAYFILFSGGSTTFQFGIPNESTSIYGAEFGQITNLKFENLDYVINESPSSVLRARNGAGINMLAVYNESQET